MQAYEPDVRLRGIGAPISAARAGEELVDCQRHESLLNLAFPGAPLWLVCPYDVETLPPVVLDEARCSHPFLSLDATVTLAMSTKATCTCGRDSSGRV